MLVLTRRRGEQIVVPDCGVTITVVSIRPGAVRLGVAAPLELPVHRLEVWQRLSALEDQTRAEQSPSCGAEAGIV